MKLVVNKTLYPKTKRVGAQKVTITEKLDGSTLGLFKQGEYLMVSQKNKIFAWNTEHTLLSKDNAYKDLIEWLEAHGQYLIDNLVDGSGLFGEWLNMGLIKYNHENRFHVFAKARFADFTITDLKYDHDTFKYVFKGQEIPDFISIVPMVATFDRIPSTEELDFLYDEYGRTVDNEVEGFVICYGENDVLKYVRFKRNKLGPHKPFPYKGK